MSSTTLPPRINIQSTGELLLGIDWLFCPIVRICVRTMLGDVRTSVRKCSDLVKKCSDLFSKA
ncbi:hypothetical protein Q8A73_000002, partial [Channa argus]